MKVTEEPTREEIMKVLAFVIGVGALLAIVSDEEKFARALGNWQRNPSPSAAFHVITTGFFLAEDIAGLG